MPVIDICGDGDLAQGKGVTPGGGEGRFWGCFEIAVARLSSYVSKNYDSPELKPFHPGFRGVSA